MTADDGMSAVHAVLSGAVQPDASGGVGDPLAKVDPRAEATQSTLIYLGIQIPYAPACARTLLREIDTADKAAGIVRLDLSDPALPTHLGDWKFRSEHLGFTADYCIRYLAAHPEDRARYRLWGVALLEFLAELGRAG